MNTPQQQFDLEVAQQVAQTPFPMEMFQVGTRELFLKAMEYNSLASMRCHIIVYRNLVTWNENTKFMMVETSLIIDVLRSVTANELCQTLEENIWMLDNIVNPIHVHFNIMKAEIEVPIRKKIETLSKIKTPSNKKIFQA